MDALFTWQTLATLAGAASMTYIIVAYTKGTLDKLFHMSTDLYAALIAALILFGANAALGTPITWQMILLSLFNGFIVAMAAGKMNDKAVTSSIVQQAATNALTPVISATNTTAATQMTTTPATESPDIANTTMAEATPKEGAL